ncbi:MAG: [ribosomal protein S5]-alanine N-acetyltransferase [Verrucomicrobiota bacterium]|jgi:RimJ/RimL family protein N-acetyltransferase
MPEARIVPPESLATERLLLRKPRPDDAALIFSGYAQDPDVVRYLTFLPHRDPKDAEEIVERFLENWRSGKSYCWLIFRRGGAELVGAISARDDQGINLGYLLARPFWGQGLMSEALSTIVEWAFSLPSVFRIWAVCDLENGASARLLERNGFNQEGILRNWSLHPNVSSTPRDCYCYARTRNEARSSDSPTSAIRD